ncbi:MAG: RNA polymerase sigma factor [Bacteroidales bacterium]
MTLVQFENQVRLNQEPLRRFLLNLCSGNSSLSDDIAQEAFIKAYTNLNSFNGMSKFSTWLFRIAYNCFIDHIRSSKRYATTELSDNISYTKESLPSKFKNEELYMALSQLGENEKTCILLFYMEDKSIKEISNITAIKENTVKSHLSRAKSNLLDHLKKVGHER